MCVFVCVCWVGRGAGPQYAGNVDAMAKWLRVTSLGYLAPEGLVEAATRSSGRPPPPLTHLVAGGPGPMADPAPMADAMRRWPASAGHSAGLSLPVGFGPVSDVWEVGGCWGGGGRGWGGCRNAALLLPGVLYRRVPRPRIQGQGGLVKPGPQPSLLPARERCGGGRGRRRWAPRDEGCVSRPARLGSRAGSDDVGGASHRPASFCEASMPAAAAAGSRVVMSHGTRSVSRA